ncbi:MAG TPA: hypothetical protein VK923_07125 [Euzebyales bacterium]|nr:hypothetical protein [Euzebyales bacterium]
MVGSAAERGNRWARGPVRDVRAGRLLVDDNTALWRVATDRDSDGAVLDRSTAAVELLNALPVNHRCAGEWMTIALMCHAVRFLTGTIDYEVPAQDLTCGCRGCRRSCTATS